MGIHHINQLLKKEDIKLYLFFLFFSIIILFFISAESYIRDPFNHVDGAIFFMSGKAWMNGMLPYVDYADSKGPLLWLINGIAYLINHYSYVGVYWLLCINYSIVFFICYKIAFLLQANKREALLASVMMSLPLLCFYFRFEARAEDFCQPFILSSLHIMLKATLNPDKTNLKKAGLIIGLGIGGCLMIKWSVALMSCSFMICTLLPAIRNKWLKTYLTSLITGFCITTLPFIVYMIIAGNLNAFILEYFINTFSTVKRPLAETIQLYIQEWLDLFKYPTRIILIVYILVILVYYIKHKNIKLYPCLCALFFLAIAIRHDLYWYYTHVCIGFSIFTCIVLSSALFKIKQIETRLYKPILILIPICLILINIKMDPRGLFYNPQNRQIEYNANYIMSQVKNPTIICNTMDRGFGILAHSYPGCRYWTRQNGEIPSMRIERIEAIKKRQADFIILLNNDPLKSLTTEAGYIFYIRIPVHGIKAVEIFGKPGLKCPPANFHISNKDVIFKKNLFNLNY